MHTPIRAKHIIIIAANIILSNLSSLTLYHIITKPIIFIYNFNHFILTKRINGLLFDYTINIILGKEMVNMKLFSRKKPPREDLLIKEINKTKHALDAAYSQFEYVVDPDLIDSCIYELNAIQNRYKYLLKQAKASGKTFVETKS